MYHSHALSLYCDNITAGEHVSGEFPTVFWERSKTLCRREAKQTGWRFFQDGRTLCPRCASIDRGELPMPDHRWDDHAPRRR